MLHHFSLHFFTPQVRGVYHDIQDTLTGCKNTVGTNHLDTPMPYLYHLPPNKASDMYTCCSNSVKLLVRASGCGVIVTEIAKSNHFKEPFGLSLVLLRRQLSLFAFPLKEIETPGLKRRLQQQQLFLHHLPPALVQRPRQVRSSSGVGSGSMLFPSI